MPRRPRPLAWLRRRRQSAPEEPSEFEFEEDDDPEPPDDGDDGQDPPGRGRGILTRLPGLIAALAIGAGFAGITYVLYLFLGPLVTALMTVGFLVGASLFPFGGFLLWWRFPKGLAEPIAFYYLRFGLLPFRDPVFRLGDGKQNVVDGALEDVGGDERYRLATRWVGFDKDSDSLEALFDGLYETPEQVEAYQPAAVADGGTAAAAAASTRRDDQDEDPTTADAPPGYVASPGLEVEGVQGYVPKTPKRDVLYVRNDKAMSPFEYAQQGGRIYKAVEVAKEKYGAGWAALPDRWVYILSAVFLVVGVVFGFLSFHL